jgi:hypothetical protein
LVKECRKIKEKITLSENSKQFNFISEWAVRIKNLLDFVTEKNPDIINFSGQCVIDVKLFDMPENNVLCVSKLLQIHFLNIAKEF